MTGNFYDVVLLGTELGPLLAGALLAKRGFRVLLVGQDDRGPTYEIAGRALPRAPYAFLGASSPVARRVLAELALHQLFRRHATTMDPPLQVALPDHRIDLALDDAELEREVAREFPEVERPVGDLHRNAARVSAELDRLLERDLVWPPETFFERREMARASQHLPFAKESERRDPFAEFPDGHPFRLIVGTPVRFADGMDPDHSTALRTLRHYHNWLRGSAMLDGGEEFLRKLIQDRIRTHSGELRPRDRADGIVVKRGTAVGVRLAGSDEEIGCSFVVAGSDLSSVLPLLPDRRPFELLFERIGEPQARYFRYTLNLVVRAEAVPVGMARDVFFVRDPRRPLWAENMLHVQADATQPDGTRLLTVEALLPRRNIEDVPGYVEGVRERVFASLGDLVPFLGKHVELVDSPHDGRDAQDLENQCDRPASDPWSRGPSTMVALNGFPVTSALGVCAMPVRTPVKRLLLCNRQVAPGLGAEGAFVTAWSVARVVTRADRKKEWMRRGLWTKVEI